MRDLDSLGREISRLQNQLDSLQAEFDEAQACRAKEPAVLAALKHTEFCDSWYKHSSSRGGCRKLLLCRAGQGGESGISASSLTAGAPAETAIRQLARVISATEDRYAGFFSR